MKNQYISCQCFSPEHLLIFSYDPDFDPGEEEFDGQVIYLHVFLRPKGVFSRIWTALQYVFGYRSQYGDFDEFLLGIEQAAEVRRFILGFEKLHRKFDDEARIGRQTASRL